jgi:hypothetical protein
MEYAIVLMAALAHAIWNELVKNSDDKLLSLTFFRFIGFVRLYRYCHTTQYADVYIALCVAGFVHSLCLLLLFN